MRIMKVAVAFVATVLAVAAGGASAAEGMKAGGAKAPAPLDLGPSAAPVPWQRYRVDSQGSAWPQADWKEYSNSRASVTPEASPPPKFTAPLVGDVDRGRQLAYDRGRGGSCVVCHIFDKTTPSQPGNVGPNLSQIGAGRTEEWLFNYVWDPRIYNKNSIMPPWGAHRVYNAAEVRDIVAFLKTLQAPYEPADKVENPTTRPAPVDNRDNLDPTENPGMFALDAGKALFAKAGPNGKSCASCHAAPEKAFKTWAATMPKWEPRLKKVLGIEEFITRHARATTGGEYLMQSDANIALSIYLRNLANGAAIKVDARSPEARAAIRRANELMLRKVGQLNMACVDCHTKERHANKWVRGQYLVEFKGTVAHFPTWRTSRGDIWDIRKRFQWCNVSVRANELPPDAPEYGDIELALAVLNQGEKLNVPGIRH
jgi:L-cysteine S-thiosulfotransferase